MNTIDNGFPQVMGSFSNNDEYGNQKRHLL